MQGVDADAQFFTDHPDRRARIRLPRKIRAINPQRAVRVADECAGEFWSLGPHDASRRRILVWRVPSDSPHYDAKRRPLLVIPFLAFADETIQDNDATLLPIIHEIMQDAAKKYGARG